MGLSIILSLVSSLKAERRASEKYECIELDDDSANGDPDQYHYDGRFLVRDCEMHPDDEAKLCIDVDIKEDSILTPPQSLSKENKMGIFVDRVVNARKLIDTNQNTATLTSTVITNNTKWKGQ